MTKSINFLSYVILLFSLIACNEPANNEDTSSSVVKTEGTKADMNNVRADIQEIENKWANAQNKKDVDALMAMYTDDAVSMQDGGPTLRGKAAIREQQEKDFAAPPKYASVAFETQDIYGTPDEVTEVGKTIYKDAAGNEIGTGKYMVVFQKKDGKYLCVREIYNKDSK
jgi:uncharacterized protein (TIGR02246 family)